jgi:hypothetical protein
VFRDLGISTFPHTLTRDSDQILLGFIGIKKAFFRGFVSGGRVGDDVHN